MMTALPFLPVPSRSFPTFLMSGINIRIKKKKKQNADIIIGLIDNWIQQIGFRINDRPKGEGR